MITIIKQKGDGYICLRTEMKEQKLEGYSANSKWRESFKEYPIRKEDEEKFKTLAFEEWMDMDSSSLLNIGNFNKRLAEGIEIDSKLVRIDKLPVPKPKTGMRTNHNEFAEYAVLVSPEEESNDEIEEVIKTMFINTVSSKKTYFGMDDFVEKLLSQFTITCKNK